MLLASALRWAPLPPALFPNGFVYFRRPLPPPAAGAPARPVLIHCNWINGIAAKRYLLREALVWDADADVSTNRSWSAQWQTPDPWRTRLSQDGFLF